MKRNLRTGAAALVALGLLAVVASAQDLPTDPSLTTGQLENGLRYIVRKHANPPGRASVYMHMHTGSLNETDRQRGIAHYLEHMAFNGSDNFPPGSVVPFFQSLGMTFGRDQNAFTNMEQTTYQLSLPDAKAETLGKGMTFFADILFRLALLPTEIESERQIIQEERRRGLSARQRVSDYVLEHIAPGSLYSQRDTIGTEASINGVTEADFRDYYGKWYTASNCTLIVVADADPAEVVKVVEEKFGAAPKKDCATPQPSGVKAYDKSFAIVTSDAEVRSEDVRIVRMEPARPTVRTVPQYRDELVMRLAQIALNRRLDDKVSKGGTSYLSAGVSEGNDANAAHTAEIAARANPGKWKSSLEEIALELQRARAFGFTSREVEDAKKQVMTSAERAVETEATQPAQGIIGRLNRDVTNGEPPMSPQQRLDLLQQLIPAISPEEIAKRFADEFDPKAVAFIAVLPSGPDVPSEAELLDIGSKALAVKPTREAEVARATELMTDLPKPGEIRKSEEHAASRVCSTWLSNNVVVHYRFMDERKNEVSVSIALIGGELLETADNRGVTAGAQVAWSRPATQRLSSSDIRELMTGKKVSVGGGGGRGRGGRRGGGGPGGGNDSISLTISGSREDLETGFQLAHLLLTEPKIEPASFTQFQTGIREMLQESLKNPMMLGMRTAGAAPYPENEPRTTPLTVAQIDKLSVEASQAWLDKLIRNSPIEVVIVGDLPKERAMELAARYLGSLPMREMVNPELYRSLRGLQRPAGPISIEKSLETETAQAFVFSGFYGADETNVADARALTMASRILSTRMVKEIREEGQLVYSIGAGSRSATTYPGFGVFSASAPTEPAKVQTLIDKLASMYAEFAASGPTEEEMDVARKQMANTFDEQMREPGFWSGQLSRLTFRGATLDDIVNEPAAFQAMTGKQVQETFAKYFKKENGIVVVVKPAAGGEEQKAAEH